MFLQQQLQLPHLTFLCAKCVIQLLPDYCVVEKVRPARLTPQPFQKCSVL